MWRMNLELITTDLILKTDSMLRHCGLWDGPIRTLAAPRAPPGGSEERLDEPRELRLVLAPEFL